MLVRTGKKILLLAWKVQRAVTHPKREAAGCVGAEKEDLGEYEPWEPLEPQSHQSHHG